MDEPLMSFELAHLWAGILEPFLGQRLLGVVDGIGAVEIVFDGEGINLLTIDIETDPVTYSQGFVSNPRQYARYSREPLPRGMDI